MLPQESTPLVVRSSMPQKHPHSAENPLHIFLNSGYRDLSGGIRSTDLILTLDSTRALARGLVPLIGRFRTTSGGLISKAPFAVSVFNRHHGSLRNTPRKHIAAL